MHRTRVLAGGLTEDELSVDNYDDLTVSEVASAVQQLTHTAALTALLRYEQNNKDRAGAVTVIENRLSTFAKGSSYYHASGSRLPQQLGEL